MSVNRKRKQVYCLVCSQSKASEFDNFCPECWHNKKKEVAEIMGFLVEDDTPTEPRLRIARRDRPVVRDSVERS
jgi:hypothetical protein